MFISRPAAKAGGLTAAGSVSSPRSQYSLISASIQLGCGSGSGCQKALSSGIRSGSRGEEVRDVDVEVVAVFAAIALLPPKVPLKIRLMARCIVRMRVFFPLWRPVLI